jgi:hypothetical protein
MKRNNGMLDRAADRLMDLDSPAYGDERERGLFMEASTFGLTLGMYLNLAAAFLAAVFGQLLLPVVLLVLMSAPSWATLWYGRRRGIDVTEMAGRASARSRTLPVAVIFGGMLLVFAVMSYTVSTGHGLFPVPEIDPTGDAMQGGVVGGTIGAAVGAVVSLLLMARRSRRRRSSDADEV